MPIEGMSEETFRTNDMALVSYFRIMKLVPLDTVWEADVCHWRFEMSPAILQAVGEFTGGKARVDPREFTRHFSLVKKEFYKSERNKRQSNVEG